jgi:hypothetical protein
MTISFRHHGTRWTLVLASSVRELIDEFSKMLERGQLDRGLFAHADRRASRLIQHPNRDGDPQFRIARILIIVTTFNPHQHRRLGSIPRPSQDGHLVTIKRVKPINNLCWTELAGSV